MALSGTLSADGNTDVVQVRGPVAVHINNDFGGGTFVVQYLSRDGNSTYRTIENTTSTADSDFSIDFPEDSIVQVRGNLSGATAPSLYWEFIGKAISKS